LELCVCDIGAEALVPSSRKYESAFMISASVSLPLKGGIPGVPFFTELNICLAERLMMFGSVALGVPLDLMNSEATIPLTP
jgi:hypothetical protein